VHVADGIYTRGTSAAHNQREARRVVDLIIEHAEQHPDKSLGVVTFSQAQRDVILDLLDEARRNRPDLDPFFSDNQLEPMFVKNLETVQGDERDVMLFSVGYGRDESGYFTMNLGPLNRQDGERRLNVAITRARERVIVVASVQPEDFDFRKTRSEGVRLLSEYMRMARDGIEAISPSVEPDRDSESPFEEAVFQELSRAGLHLVKQVGVARYRIDMAVVDPMRPGHYILGIECDGAMYHSAATARERDRLRQQVLEHLGWHLHRIWSRDWYENPQREVEKVLKAVQEASTNRKPKGSQPDPQSPTARGSATRPQPSPPPPPKPVPQPPEAPLYPPEAKPYQTAVVQFRPGVRLVQTDWATITNGIEQLVKTEGPVHIDLLMTRLVDAAGDSRLGSRTKAMLRTTLNLGDRQARWRLDADGFVWPVAQHDVIARYPTSDATTRRIDHICKEELAEAAWLVIRDAMSLEPDQAVQATARFFGKNATGAVAQRLCGVLDGLVREGRLERMSDGRLRPS
jgi:very-short-patch-repair endonuclease